MCDLLPGIHDLLQIETTRIAVEMKSSINMFRYLVFVIQHLGTYQLSLEFIHTYSTGSCNPEVIRQTQIYFSHHCKPVSLVGKVLAKQIWASAFSKKSTATFSVLSKFYLVFIGMCKFMFNNNVFKFFQGQLRYHVIVDSNVGLTKFSVSWQIVVLTTHISKN